MRLFASEFAAVPGKLELTIYLTRIVFPFLTLVAVAAAMMGMLNSLGHFFVPALSPAMFNVAIVADVAGADPVRAVARRDANHHRRDRAPWSAASARSPFSGRRSVAKGFGTGRVLDFSDEGLHRVLLLMGPGTIGMAATQINVFVNTVLATGEGTGAVSWLDFAFRLMYLPIGLFGVSIATAATPAISRMVARTGLRADPFDAGQRPRADAVPQRAGHGRADGPGRADRRGDLRTRRVHRRRHDGHGRARCSCYAIGLVGYSVVRIISPTFYALRPEPDSGDGVGGVGGRQRRRSTSRWCG